MTLEQADALIKESIDKMNAIYRQPVFDELKPISKGWF